MSEVPYGRVRARFVSSAYHVAATAKDVRASCYPTWIKALFVGGIALIVISVLSILLSVFVRNMPGVDILCMGILAGLAALYAVATLAPRYRATS